MHRELTKLVARDTAVCILLLTWEGREADFTTT
jgi:hypothetical protein